MINKEEYGIQIVTEDVFFMSDSYLLHGELTYPNTGNVNLAVVIAGPHPFLGGNIQNNVVKSVGNGLADHGAMTLRFDYRGIGRSQGPEIDLGEHLADFWKTSHVSGEMDFWKDVQAAADFIHQTDPFIPLVLIGYSFGSCLLPFVKAKGQLSRMILIAPTIVKHDYDFFKSVVVPLLIIASEDDFATSSEQIREWFETLIMPKQLMLRKCDNHFFRGHESWLIDSTVEFLFPTGSI